MLTNSTYKTNLELPIPIKVFIDILPKHIKKTQN